VLRCEECGCVSNGKAKSWVAYTAPDSDDESGVIVVVYCPVCASRENFAALSEPYT
jgi:hypothetical protein